jgi:hypothetical protein
MSLIWTCPDCGSDLVDEYWNFWCQECSREVSWLEFAEFAEGDERRDFLTMEEVNADGV